ncbi:hypothetical protein N658DRAFT_429245 [Parathielavia hyrcaniae]|uniref:C2H2-type domain-containing protein n=1 Tax=Parathielavia hyrcaniae TaxID=113614 RepID=A0AAN6Q2F0_9PEZI|nr:hypothetical protein N658DRAFT_429245 [Parathielavia hyrcaniae]
MANSEQVFQQRYLPQHIRKEIMPIVFGVEAAGENEELYTMLRRATVTRDENAPLYLTIKEKQRLEERRDMQKLKREYGAERDAKGEKHPHAKRAFSAYAAYRRTLQQLLLDHKRKEYFVEADRRRALGQSTSDLATPTAELSKPQTHTRVTDRFATHIGRFLHEKHLGGARRAQFFSQLLLAYLGKRCTEIVTIMDSLEDTKSDITESKPEGYMCLLCRAPFPFRGGLTRHNDKVHLRKGAFNYPFSCPECSRQGNEKFMVKGVEQWSSHVERCHGILFTPNLPSRNRTEPPAWQQSPRTRSARCLVCEGMFSPGNSFSRHFNKEHGDLFQEPFACFECRRQDGSVIMIGSREAWMEHVAEVHKHDGQTMDSLLEPRKLLGKRKREGGE